MPQLRISKNGKLVNTVNLDIGQEYLAGRDSSCAINLNDEAISRKHFKIWNHEGQWRVERVSKFGQLIHEGQAVSNVELSDLSYFSAPPFTFEFTISDLSSAGNSSKSASSFDEVQEEAAPFESTKDKESSFESNEPSVSSPEHAELNVRSDSDSESLSIEENLLDDENTIVGGTQVGYSNQAYLRVIQPSGEEESHPLDSKSLKVGRSPQCDIAIEDSKASRIHFEILRTGNQFLLVDQGSSNGTKLNGSKIAKNESITLANGDEIQVGEIRFIVEIRDPSYEKRLKAVPSELLQPESSLVPYQGGESQYPVVPIPQNVGPIIFAGLPKRKSRDEQKKLIFRGAIFVGLIIIGYLALSDNAEKPVDPSVEKPQEKVKDPFAALSEQDQQLVISSYNLGKTLYMQQKYELALSEIQKIAQFVPSYKDSKEIEKYCQEAIDLKADQDRIQRDQEARQKLVAKVNNIIAECEKLVLQKGTLEQVQHCLEPVTMELDPENSKAAQILGVLRKNEEEKQLSIERDRKFKSSVNQGAELYRKAMNLKAMGKPYDAIEAFQRHIASSYPDPQNLKSKSKTEIATIERNLSNEVSKLLAEAKSAYAEKKMADAMRRIDKALSIDMDNQDARSLKETIVNELYKEMKAIYSDSVLEENLGNVEQAKEKWRKIINTDVPSGEYYQKAKSKLKKYGG